MSNLKDLTGQKFGRLTVISRAENKGKATRWNCLCDCGNEKIVYRTNLTRGLTTSCGCFRKEKLSQIKLENIVGNKYGRLTVTELDHYDSALRQYYWKCECECGGKCIVYGGHLKDGHTKSCGCLKSNGEERIAEILSNNNINFIKQYSFSELIGVGRGKLYFDFAVLDKEGNLLYLIEYDGKQHYIKSNTKWDINGSFEKRQANDKIKNEFCKEKQIHLIRIKNIPPEKLTLGDLVYE